MSQEGKFTCSNCLMSCKYDYFGRNPPHYKFLEVKEEIYSARDPFTNERGCILLGGHCQFCKKVFCMANECSIFYNNRSCLKCANGRLDSFPSEIQVEIEKRSVG